MLALTGEEPQPLSGLPDPRANAQASGRERSEGVTTDLQLRVREASFRRQDLHLLARGIVISHMGQAIKE